MCESCNKVREECWAEIRDLLNFNRKVKGPLSEKIAEAYEAAQERAEAEGVDTHNGPMTLESIRAEMIAARCAAIARACPDTRFHGALPSEILGSWAGAAMQAEMQFFLEGSPLGVILGSLLGFGPQEEDDDD